MVKKVYEWSPALTRSLGRPKNRWEDDVKSDITKMVMQVQLKTVALHVKQAAGGSRGIAVPSHDPGARSGWWSAPRTGRFNPRKRKPVIFFYRRLVEPRIWYGWVRKISPPLGWVFEPRTIHPSFSSTTLVVHVLWQFANYV
jgi:hypothetical protein